MRNNSNDDIEIVYETSVYVLDPRLRTQLPNTRTVNVFVAGICRLYVRLPAVRVLTNQESAA